MTEIKKKILDKLGEAYEKESSIENATKLVEFVEGELAPEIYSCIRKKESQFIGFKIMTVIIYSILSMLLCYLLGKISANELFDFNPMIIVLMSLFFYFVADKKIGIYEKLKKPFQEEIDKFNFFFQAKKKIDDFKIQQREQELVKKYLGRDGNPIDSEL